MSSTTERKDMPFVSKKPFQYNYDKKLRNNHMQRACQWIADIIIGRAFESVEYHNPENVPDEGPFILCANHVSATDPVNLSRGFRGKRELWFMAKSEYYQMFYTRWGLNIFNGFPVHRVGAPDLSALRFAIRVLKDGRFGLVIFPQGGRDLTRKHPRETPAKAGTAAVVREAKVPVVPASIHMDPNLDELNPRVVIRYGKPIAYEEFGFTEGKRNHKELQKATDLIMERIYELWEQDFKDA